VSDAPARRVPDGALPVYVAAGSNVAPVESLAKALEALRERFPDLVVSPAYQNAAVGFEGDDFINLAVGFSTRLPLAGLLAELHAIEALCGRGRDEPKWAKRRMDLDVLLFGDIVGEFPGAKLPRPDLVRRAFMLGPLADIAPDALHPTLGITIAELWSRFDRAAHPMQPVALPGRAARP
jgi:2-amino-4-hydroxy-6-hydroxymethyldihydropteridine diphosphokinase